MDGYFARVNKRFEADLPKGLRVRGDTRDLIERYIYLFGSWEPALTHWLCIRLAPGDAFIDVGANIGYYSLLASRCVGSSGTVVAIEASPAICNRLRENVTLNALPNVRVVNLAASDSEGSIRVFEAHHDNFGATSVYPQTYQTNEVEVRRRPLSEIIPTDTMRHVRAIKIDVEGAEASVVRGLLPLLRESRDDLELVVEVGGGPVGSPPPVEAARELMEMLLPQGFACFRLRNDYAARSYRRAPKRNLERVPRSEHITFECDLIFSRRDPSTQMLPIDDWLSRE